MSRDAPGDPVVENPASAGGAGVTPVWAEATCLGAATPTSCTAEPAAATTDARASRAYAQRRQKTLQ